MPASLHSKGSTYCKTLLSSILSLSALVVRQKQIRYYYFLFSIPGCTYIDSEHNDCSTMSLEFQWTWTVFCGLKQLSISWQMPTYIQCILKSLFIDEISMLLPSWKAITAYKEQWWNSQCKQYKTTIKPKRLYCFILTITHLALAILHQSCQKGLVEQPRFLQASRNVMGVGVWRGEGASCSRGREALHKAWLVFWDPHNIQ